MEDRKCHSSSRWSRTVIVLASFVCMGALVALSQQAGVSVYADPIPTPDGTPSYLPLAMFAPTPTPIPEPGRIVYETHFDWTDNWEIFSMDADGTHKTQLTHHPERDSDAAWSPDQSQIVFASERVGADPPNREIYVMSAAGDQPGGATRLTFVAGKEYDPSWSPNGQRIAFVSKRDGDWDIYLMDPDGTHLVNLTNNKCTDTDPSWSPDGSRIAFASDRHNPGQNSEIYTMKADGTDVKRLTNTIYSDGDPSWSWDGTRIAFECFRDGNSEICVMNANGTGQQRITYNEASDSDPSWQRWGDQIVFGSYRTGNGDVYVMNSDGSGVTQLTDNPYIDGDPCARPSGP